MDESVKQVVEAPIIGSASADPKIEAGLEGEYQEFLRAYKCAFLHWLRSASAPVKENPEQRFARFVAA